MSNPVDHPLAPTPERPAGAQLLRGTDRPAGADAPLGRSLLVYGAGRLVVPCVGLEGVELDLTALEVDEALGPPEVA